MLLLMACLELVIPTMALAANVEDQLKLIGDTADEICNVIATTGNAQNEKVKGELKAQLGGLAAKLADVGVSGSGSLNSEKYQNVLRQDLAEIFESNANCKLKVFQALQDKLITPAPPRPTEAENRYYASRIFAGPMQYPPTAFAAYGIVAFPVRATAHDLLRYIMICEAYVSALLFTTELSTPISKQMVTVWPIDSDLEATRVNRKSRDDVCADAVSHYGLLTAQEAILDARKNGARIDGLGPFLLAWSPAGQKGKADALVLVSDLSEVTTIEQAKSLFMEWSRDIEINPELWDKGWNISKIRTIIRLWADKYGEKLLQLAGLK